MKILQDIPKRTKILRIGEIILIAGLIIGLGGWKIADYVRTPDPYKHSDLWTLVIEDNFDGNTIDESLWSYGYPNMSWNCQGQCHNHQGWQAPENVIVENGLLRIKGENKTHPDAPIDHMWGDTSLPLNYTVGAITTYNKFNFTYGYVEARQKMPAGDSGFWPAFWTIQFGTPGVYGEIDIHEWYSGRNNAYETNLHTHGEGEELHSDMERHSHLPDLTSDFHIYGVEWLPDRISFYFDNKEVRRITNQDYIEHLGPQHIRINLAIGRGDIAPDENTIWPAWYETDWVRVWQYNDYL